MDEAIWTERDDKLPCVGVEVLVSTVMGEVFMAHLEIAETDIEYLKIKEGDRIWKLSRSTTSPTPAPLGYVLAWTHLPQY